MANDSFTNPIYRRCKAYQVVADATSDRTADRFNELVGGMAVYIPAAVEDDHWLTKAVGRADAQAICDILANGFGDVFDFPLGNQSNRAKVQQAIIEMLESGQSLSSNEIATAAGCNRRTVQRIKRRLEQFRKSDRQQQVQS